MGSFGSKKCVPVTAYDARRNSNHYEPSEATSFSNPSLVTLTSVETNAIEVSPSLRFTEDYMNTVYERFKEDNDLDNNLSYNVVRIVTSIVETLSMDDHILFIANKFFDRIYSEDVQYMNEFGNSVAKNEITQFENKELLLEHHMILHIMFFVRLHKFILTTLDDGKEEKAYEILNLIALSHLIMKVDPNSFNQQTVKITQAIIHFNLMNDDQIPPFIYYVITVTGYICTMMEKYSERNVKLYDTIVDYNSPARENYRELKKWKAIVAALKKSLTKPILQLEKQVEEEKRKQNSTTLEDDREQWNIIRLLKKGYKYKNKDGDHLKQLHTKLK